MRKNYPMIYYRIVNLEYQTLTRITIPINDLDFGDV